MTTTITRESVAVRCAGGEMGAYYAAPAEARGLGIVMLQEIFGVNNAMRAKADAFAEAGFAVLVPDLFWRLEPNVALGYGEADRQKGFGLLQQIDFKRALADVAAAHADLIKRPECTGRAAMLGFCLGGKLAVVAGAMVPDTAAVVSFYGVRLDENLEQIASMACPLQIHVGDEDSHVPIETVEVLRDAVAARDDAEVFVYPGAGHGFFNRKRDDVFDPTAAERAMARATALLRHVAD